MANFKGGRGKRAPYETELLRVPTPIKPLVQALTESYRKTADTDPAGEKLSNSIQIATTGRNPVLEQMLAATKAQLAEAEAKIARGNDYVAEMREEIDILNRQLEKLDKKKKPKGFGNLLTGN